MRNIKFDNDRIELWQFECDFGNKILMKNFVGSCMV